MSTLVTAVRHGSITIGCTADCIPRRASLGLGCGIAAAGWSLIELMIVLAVAALLLTAAAPQYGDWVARYQVANEAQQLAESMNLARAEAIKRGQRVNLCRTADRQRCGSGGGWDAGWLVYVDINRNGHIDDDEPLLRTESAAASGIRVTANRPLTDYVSYTSLGNARLLSGALQMGTFTLCRPGFPEVRVVLANSGRARVESSRDPCV